MTDYQSSRYALDCGVRQNGLTLLKLFSLYRNELIAELSHLRVGSYLGDVCINNNSYADDMLLQAQSISAVRKLVTV